MASPDDPRCRAAPAIRLIADDDGTRGIEARCYVAAPPRLVLDLLWQPENFAELFPALEHVEVLSLEAATADVAYRFDAIGRKLGYVLRRTLEAERGRLSWRKLSGDLVRVHGSWTIAGADAPDLCHATYRAFVDVGRLVPTRLVAMGAKRSTRQMVRRVRDIAQQRARAARG